MTARSDLPRSHQPLTAETFAVLAARTAGEDTGVAVVTILDADGRSDGALFVLDLPADPAGRTHIVDVLREAAAGRLDGNAGYLAYALVEDTDGQRMTFAVIEPITPGPGSDRGR